MTIIASCIVSTGYGTDCYDEETSECAQSAYASVEFVALNEPYWAQYDSMSGALHNDFKLPWGFDDYVLMVDDMGYRSFRNTEDRELKGLRDARDAAVEDYQKIEHQILASEHVLAREEQTGNIPLLHQRIHKLLPKQPAITDEIMRLIDKFLGK
jgi:hypothetical protein